MRHQDYRPMKTKQFEDDWIILPVDGYGNEDMIRRILDQEKIDAIHFTTDPRFYGWLFNMADEIRDRGIPLLYWHVWDADPTPVFNKQFYESCDYIGCISKLTHEIVTNLGFANSSGYIPHASNAEIFKPLSKEQIMQKRAEMLGPNQNKFIVFYNSRNARRKKTSDVLKTFAQLLNTIGQDKAFLLMKTDPHDPEGGNLIEVAKMLGLKNDQVTFAPNMTSQEQMADFYNIADITVCHSSNEGFGLSCQESLYCGTPTIVMQTGGLQEQPVDDLTGETYGVVIPPVARSLQGSQQIPFIFDDHGSDQDFLNAYHAMYLMGFDKRKELGLRAAESVRRRYPMEGMIKKWDDALEKYIQQYRNNENPRVKFAKV